MKEEKRQLIKKCVALSVKAYETRFDSKEMGFSSHSFLAIGNASVHILSTAKYVFLAFPGTNPKDLRDWVTDAKFKRNKDDKHTGLCDYMDKLASKINIELIAKKYDKKALVCVGHSLGGQAAIEYCDRIIRKIELILTVGAPRVGGEKFINQFKYKDKVVHIINYNDPVPLVPPVSLGYKDLPGDVIYFDKSGRVRNKPPLFTRIINFFFKPKGFLLTRNLAQHDKEIYLSLVSHVL